MSLEEIIRKRQDELRGRPETAWEKMRDRARHVDWEGISFDLLLIITAFELAICSVAVVMLARAMPRF